MGDAMVITPKQLVTIDDNGDLILRVGADEGSRDDWNEVKEYKVDSATLRRTSAVFRAMLFGPWTEASKPTAGSEQWTIELPEDNPDWFIILMGIAHACFKLVPRPEDWTKTSVNGLVVLADKYDMLHLLGPFAPSMARTIGHSPKRRVDDESFLILQTSWELGCEQEFARGLKNIILFTSLNKEGSNPNQLIYRCSTHGTPHINLAEFLEPEILEQITKERLRVIKQLVKFINDEYGRCCESCVISSWKTRFKCSQAVKDGLEQVIKKTTCRPFLPIEVEAIHCSAKGFYQSSIRDLKRIQVPASHRKTCSQVTAKRFEALWADIKTSYRWEPSVLLTQEQREWMKKRRERIGY